MKEGSTVYTYVPNQVVPKESTHNGRFPFSQNVGGRGKEGAVVVCGVVQAGPVFKRKAGRLGTTPHHLVHSNGSSMGTKGPKGHIAGCQNCWQWAKAWDGI